MGENEADLGNFVDERFGHHRFGVSGISLKYGIYTHHLKVRQ